MFTTYQAPDIESALLYGNAVPMISASVEHELRPWFYLQVVRRPRRSIRQTMVLLYRLQDLKLAIARQSATFGIQRVYIATPPSINGQKQWLMEPLEQVKKVLSPVDWKDHLVYVVAGKKTYAAKSPVDLRDAVVSKIVFSAATDLRDLA